MPHLAAMHSACRWGRCDELCWDAVRMAPKVKKNQMRWVQVVRQGRRVVNASVSMED